MFSKCLAIIPLLKQALDYQGTGMRLIIRILVLERVLNTNGMGPITKRNLMKILAI